MKKLIETYMKQLACMDVKVDPESKQLIALGDTEDSDIPLTISGKILTLPSEETLSDLSNHKDKIFYHPLSESSSKRISVVQKRIVKLMEVQLNTIVRELVITIVKAMMDDKATSKIPLVLSKALAGVDKDHGSMKEKTRDYLIKQLENMDPAGSHVFLRIKLKDNPEIGGKKYLRGVRFTSPMLEHLRNEETDHFVTAKWPNKSAHGIILDIVEMVIGKKRNLITKRDEMDDYSVGVHTHCAPNFTATVQAHGVIMADLEYLCQVLKRLLKHYGFEYSLRKRDWDWLEDIPKFKDMANHIPPLEGNYTTSKDSLAFQSDEPAKTTVHESRPMVDEPEPQHRTVAREVVVDKDTTTTAEEPANRFVQPPKPAEGVRTLADIAPQPAPVQPPVQQGAWNQPQQVNNGWYQPAPQQGTGWGQTQQPVNNGWGQPQPQMGTGWGQPQQPVNNGWGSFGQTTMYQQPQQPSMNDLASRPVDLGSFGQKTGW